MRQRYGSTLCTERIASRSNMESWLLKHRRRKWALAGRLARAEDGRWSNKIITWNPAEEGRRDQARPRLRWSDSIVGFAGGWVDAAKDFDLWASLEEGYVNIN